MIPSNELEVIAVFMQAIPEGWNVLSLDGSFPDGTLEIDGKEAKVEFEFRATNFIQHGHDISGCDLIICWEDDWGETCPLPILPLKEQVPKDFVIAPFDLRKAFDYEHDLNENLKRRVYFLAQKVRTLEEQIMSMREVIGEDNEAKKDRVPVSQRRDELFELLCEDLNQRTEDFAKRFGVSDQTIRDDYRALEAEGKILYNRGKVAIPLERGDF